MVAKQGEIAENSVLVSVRSAQFSGPGPPP